MAEEKKYYSIVTDAGTAAVVLSITEGRKVNLTKFAVGDGGGSYYRPTKDMLQLRNERFRGNIKSYETDPLSPNIAVIRAILPYSVGGWTVREMGVFDEDGTLIGVGNMPEMEKVAAESGASYEMELTMRIAVSNIEQLDFKFDPVTILLTKRDLDAHNIDPKAHKELFVNLDFNAEGKQFRMKRAKEADLPILAEGEPGFALDSKKMFVGMGKENILVSGGAPKVHETTLLASSWTGNAVPFTQEINVPEVTADSLLVVSVKQEQEMIETVSNCNVTATGQRANKVTFTARDGKPPKDLAFLILDWGEV